MIPLNVSTLKKTIVILKDIKQKGSYSFLGKLCRYWFMIIMIRRKFMIVYHNVWTARPESKHREEYSLTKAYYKCRANDVLILANAFLR